MTRLFVLFMFYFYLFFLFTLSCTVFLLFSKSTTSCVIIVVQWEMICIGVITHIHSQRINDTDARLASTHWSDTHSHKQNYTQ